MPGHVTCVHKPKTFHGPFYFLWGFVPSLPPQVVALVSLAPANYLFAPGKRGSDWQSKSSLGQKNAQLYLPKLLPSVHLSATLPIITVALVLLRFFLAWGCLISSVPLDFQFLTCQTLQVPGVCIYSQLAQGINTPIFFKIMSLKMYQYGLKEYLICSSTFRNLLSDCINMLSSFVPRGLGTWQSECNTT